MIVRATLLFALFCVAALRSGAALADGGQLQSSEVIETLRVSVFTSPARAQIGELDVSVLVQDAVTGATIHNAEVEIEARQTSQKPLKYRASHAAATNKLFQAAWFDMPFGGEWTFRVHVKNRDARATTEFALQVYEASPHSSSDWIWIAWPFAVMAVFALTKFNAFRRERPSATPPQMAQHSVQRATDFALHPRH